MVCATPSLSTFYLVSISLIVSKFLGGFSFHVIIFQPLVNVTILTYNRHSWPLSSEGSLACHTGHFFIWSFLRTHDNQTCCLTLSSGGVNTCINSMSLVIWVWTALSHIRGERSTNWWRQHSSCCTGHFHLYQN